MEISSGCWERNMTWTICYGLVNLNPRTYRSVNDLCINKVCRSGDNLTSESCFADWILQERVASVTLNPPASILLGPLNQLHRSIGPIGNLAIQTV